MAKPNVFILGAPKCGTTTLTAWLANHPQVFFRPIKEPHFFNFGYSERRFRSLTRYEKLFACAEDNHCAVIEASTGYLYSRTAVPAILRYCKHPKFIITIRNPVDMAPSLQQYGNICRLGAQLARLYERVHAAQILVLRLDTISRAPRNEYQRVLDFLGLEDDEREDFGTHNTAKQRRLPRFGTRSSGRIERY